MKYIRKKDGLLETGVAWNETDVLNGIAFNPDSNTVYVTGKYWCRLFELEFIP